MISLKIIILIMLWHWLADFVLQTDWQAQNKWNNSGALLAHTGIYSASWFVPIIFIDIFFTQFFIVIWFIPITFIFHTLTDYITSKVNHYLYYNKKDIHKFFVSIGFDQFLHITQLLLTYYWLS